MHLPIFLIIWTISILLIAIAGSFKMIYKQEIPFHLYPIISLLMIIDFITIFTAIVSIIR